MLPSGVRAVNTVALLLPEFAARKSCS